VRNVTPWCAVDGSGDMAWEKTIGGQAKNDRGKLVIWRLMKSERGQETEGRTSSLIPAGEDRKTVQKKSSLVLIDRSTIHVAPLLNRKPFSEVSVVTAAGGTVEASSNTRMCGPGGASLGNEKVAIRRHRLSNRKTWPENYAMITGIKKKEIAGHRGIKKEKARMSLN